MIPQQVIIAILIGLGAALIGREALRAWRFWRTYSEFGEDRLLRERLERLLADLPEGFYNSEHWIASRRVMRDLSEDGEVPQLQQRLAFLAERGVLEFRSDPAQGDGPQGRLYRLRIASGRRPS